MRRRFGILASGLVLALGLLVWSIWPALLPDPVVRGKPLSVWLDQRQKRPDGLMVLTDEAAGAVRALGPDAAPTLLEILRRSDPALTRGWVFLNRVLHIQNRGTATELARKRAVLGFRALGPAARPAWPALVDLALRPADDFQFRDAIDSLTAANVATIRLLAEGTKSPDRNVRSRAIMAMQILRLAPAEVILPALEALKSDPDLGIRSHVLLAIPDILDDLVSYATLLRSADPQRRATFARLIGGFGTRARNYLPDLRALADDPDPNVRAAVAEAIRQIEGPTAPSSTGETVGKPVSAGPAVHP